jgi:hypothetical protein
VAVTGRLIDFQRLEQVIEPAGEVLPEHVAIVQASFAVMLRCAELVAVFEVADHP